MRDLVMNYLPLTLAFMAPMAPRRHEPDRSEGGPYGTFIVWFALGYIGGRFLRDCLKK